MPRGSKPGERRGGRKKGFRNLRTIWYEKAVDTMKAEGVNPLQVLARATKGDEVSALQVRAAIELAKYGWAQLTRVEHTGFGGGPVEVKTYNLAALSVDELTELYRLREKMQPAEITDGTAASAVIETKAEEVA